MLLFNCETLTIGTGAVTPVYQGRLSPIAATVTVIRSGAGSNCTRWCSYMGNYL